MPPTVSEQSRWFAEEVQPHEPALRAYLHARFPSLSDQDDLVQETYTRLLRARESGKINFVKAFLFKTAHNAAIDFFRRRKPVLTPSDLPVEDEVRNAADITHGRHEREMLAEAIATLPERCREVVILRYREGLANRAIAERLGISPETVKIHLAKGVRRCAEHFQTRGLLRSSGKALT